VTHRIFLVDDHPVFRHGLRGLIAEETDLEICGEAESTEEAIEKIPEYAPDIVLVDISLKGVSGIELIKALKTSQPELPTLVLSMHDEDLFAERAVRAGAAGYLMKHEAADRVVEAIRGALRGDLVLSRQLSENLLRRALQGTGARPGSPLEVLSDRELEVFEHIGRGLGTREIAETLHISVKTVETHKANIKEKLDLHNATELLRAAVGWTAELSNGRGKPE
jgi:DNA-binding NarL/FixJ family response regulator